MIRTKAAALALSLLFPLAGADMPPATPGMQYVGLTPGGLRIVANSVPGPLGAAPTVLLIGGLNGNDASAATVTDEARRFSRTTRSKRRYRLLSIPLANPAASKLIFPPAGTAYRDNAESNELWRWIGIQAPDFVIIVANEDFGLAEALSRNVVAGVGSIPAVRVAPALRTAAERGILRLVPADVRASGAHRELLRRTERSPRQVADELAQYYGHTFPDAIYINAIALIGQLRLGNVAEVRKLVEPYVDGTKDSLARPTSLHLAGHLIFAELAVRTADPRYLQLVRRVAELGFTPNGEMRESMPFHDEMSDSVFMAAPIVAKAGALTGENKYFDMAARHVAFMQKLVLRPDGLYRHSPLTDAAWGRGNAFPALGLALTLEAFPKTHPEYRHLLQAFQRHMARLAEFQLPESEGMWHEVIDEPASYAEFSATAMIATAMAMGVRNGWLDSRTYQPLVDNAWRGVVRRIGAEGVLMDVCESTNKQPSLDAYLHRAAILGNDPRGGAMALLFATEMAGLGK
ncbi:MAG TPA: glycoside hydrolase family 88 protein [Bryobacteraceae bacterium]|nr:glycoside hydrolase family 88 protein [Bryobacteraceae bacterium]